MSGYSEMVSGWSLVQSEFGVTGTRVFITGTGISGSLAEPKVGDNFFLTVVDEKNELGATAPLNRVLLREIQKEYIAGDKNYTKYSCSYSNELTDWSSLKTGETLDLSTLPIKLQFGGEYQSIIPGQHGIKSDWYMLSDGKNIIDGTPIPYQLMTSTLKVNRIFTEAMFNKFTSICSKYAGYINGEIPLQLEAPDFPTDPYPSNISHGNNLMDGFEGCWLFTGFTAEPFFNHEDKRCYNVEIAFQFKAPSNYNKPNYYNNYGWDMILSKFYKDGWIIPYRKDTGFADCFMYRGKTNLQNSILNPS